MSTEIALGDIAGTNEAGAIVVRISGFHEQEKVLAEMEEKAKGGIVWNCQDAQQDKHAREWRRRAVQGRTGLNALRLDMSRPLDEAKRVLMDAEKSIEQRFRDLESMADAPIKAEERRLADIKAEAERVEAERVAGIMALIAEIREFGKPDDPFCDLTSTEIRERQSHVQNVTVDGRHAEFQMQAMTAIQETRDKLALMLGQAVQREDRERKAVEDAREVERLRAEAAERDRLQAIADAEAQRERDRIAAETAAQLREAQAKIAQQEEQQKQERERAEQQERERNAEIERIAASHKAEIEASDKRQRELQEQIEASRQAEIKRDQERIAQEEQTRLDAELATQAETDAKNAAISKYAPSAITDEERAEFNASVERHWLNKPAILTRENFRARDTLQPEHVHCGAPEKCCCPAGIKALQEIVRLCDSPALISRECYREVATAALDGLACMEGIK